MIKINQGLTILVAILLTILTLLPLWIITLKDEGLAYFLSGIWCCLAIWIFSIFVIKTNLNSSMEEN